jgi:hypothetical protein
LPRVSQNDTVYISTGREEGAREYPDAECQSGTITTDLNADIIERGRTDETKRERFEAKTVLYVKIQRTEERDADAGTE